MHESRYFKLHSISWGERCQHLISQLYGLMGSNARWHQFRPISPGTSRRVTKLERILCHGCWSETLAWNFPVQDLQLGKSPCRPLHAKDQPYHKVPISCSSLAVWEGQNAQKVQTLT
jgi:hypothetical protein